MTDVHVVHNGSNGSSQRNVRVLPNITNNNSFLHVTIFLLQALVNFDQTSSTAKLLSIPFSSVDQAFSLPTCVCSLCHFGGKVVSLSTRHFRVSGSQYAFRSEEDERCGFCFHTHTFIVHTFRFLQVVFFGFTSSTCIRTASVSKWLRRQAEDAAGGQVHNPREGCFITQSLRL